MRRLNIPGLLILTLLGLTTQVGAFNFGPHFPGASGRDQRSPPGLESWQYRPQELDNARGVPPSYQPPGALPGQIPGYPQPGPGGYQPGWPGYQLPYGQPMVRQTNQPPRLELVLDDHQPYIQENVLLKLRVISSENLATATPELPNSNDVLLQKLEGPEASSRTGAQGSREIVNEFIYALTPLRAGTIEVPSPQVTGTLAGNGWTGARRFEATGTEPIRLQVRPAMASVQPWLPLQNLALKATLDGGDRVEHGEPVTLTLELIALGATGNQLPSLESQLRSPDFRVYREQTLNEGYLSEDKRRIEGHRTEYFTLVPHADGKLLLPDIRLAWWNVATGTKEYAGLPVHKLRVDDGAGRTTPSLEVATTTKGGGPSWLWLLLAGIVLLLLGYWGGTRYQGRAPRGATETGTTPTLDKHLVAGLGRAARVVSTHTAKLAKHLDTAPLYGRIRSHWERALPPSTRFLRCVRVADREDGPTAWAERFQDLTRHHLQFDTRISLPSIAGRILALRPGADPEQLEYLMRQLDGALYGQQDIDFGRWKKQFHAQIGRRRGLAKVGGARLRPRIRPRLPALNPRFG